MANSAVIGILKALLTADTGEFTSAMKAAGADVQELGNKLAKDLEPRQRSINRLVSEFLGGQEIRRAQEYAAAVEKIGGAANLTAGDQEKVNRAVGAALEHYRALNQEAPKNLVKLAAETAKVETAWEKADRALGKFGLSLSGLTLAGITTGLIAAGNEAIKFGSALADLSASTGLTYQELQRLGFAGEQVGVSMDQVARGVQRLQRELVQGEKGTTEAIQKLGLSIKELLAMSPGAMFETIASRIKEIEDPAQRTATAIELLGKSGGDLLPLLTADIDKLTESFKGMTDEAVENLDAFDDAIARLKVNFKSAIGEMISDLSTWRGALKAGGKVGTFGFSEDVEKFAKETSDALKNQAKELADVTGLAASRLASSNGLTPALKDASKALKEFEADNKPATEAMKKAWAAAEAYQQKIAALAAQLSGDALRSDVLDIARAVEQLDRQGQTISEKALPGFVKRLNELKAAGADLPPILEKIRTATGQWLADAPRVQMFSDQFKTGLMELVDASAEFNNQLEETIRLTNHVGELDQFISKVLPKGLLGPGVTLDPPPGIWATFTKSAENYFSKTLPNVVNSAIQGGGDLWRAIGASFGAFLFSDEGFGKSITNALKNHLGKIGGFLSSLLPGIGSLVGSLAGKLGDFFSNTFGEGKGRKMVVAFADSMGGFDELHRKLLELGDEGERLWVRLTQGVNKGDTKAAQAAIDAVLKALQKGTNDATAAQERLNAAAAKYGFTWEQMGPQIRATKIQEWAEELLLDMKALTGAGIEQSEVLDAMSDDWSAMVQSALRGGVEIPQSMKATIQSLIDMGQLVDENGDLITDISKIPFAQSMTEGFKTVESAVDRLGETLKEIFGKAIPRAIDESTTAVERFRRVVDAAPRGVGGGGEMPAASSLAAALSPASFPMMSVSAAGLPARGGGGTVVLQMNGRDFYRATFPDLVDTLKQHQVSR